MHFVQRSLGLTAVLFLSLVAVSPCPAQVDGPKEEPDKTEAIVTQLRDLKKSIEDLGKQVKAANEELDKKLKAYLENPETNAQLRFTKMQADAEDLRKQMAQIQKDLQAMDARLREPRVALYGPPAPTTGRVRLVNTYLDPMTVLVNDRAYRLAPGATQLSDAIPAGNFNYQVLGVQNEPQVRRLAADEVFTITIHPR